jgi:hypothetical protein
MRVDKDQTIGRSENYLSNLAGTATDYTLTVPKHLGAPAAGGEASLVQFLLTWAQGGRTHAQLHLTPDHQELSDYTRELFGLILSLVADEAKTVGDKTEISEALRQAGLATLKHSQSLRPRGALKGPQLAILCADSLNNPASALLHDPDGKGGAKLKSAAAYDEVAGMMLAATLQQNQQVGAGLVEAVASAIYELFRNTEEHGKLDQRGDLVRRSVRGIHARRHELTPEALLRMTEESPPVAAYCRSLPTAHSGAAHIQLLEISVFDAGAGYASRFRRKPLAELTAEDELAAVHECFAKHATVKTDHGAGLGLCNLISILRRRSGFLRLRTGRYSLYADLSGEKDRSYGEAPEMKHWRKHSRLLPETAGSLITFFIPIIG